MSATISVQSGISAGTTYWIERPVLRVGSDPASDLCLLSTAVSPHALTVEYRAGEYRVHNRSNAPVQIGRQTLAVGKSAIWMSEQALTLAGDNQLVLEYEGDGAPSPKPAAGYGPEGDEEEVIRTTDKDDGEESAEEKAKRSKSNMQFAVIGLCVLGMAGMMLVPRGSAGTTQQAPSFSRIVVRALDSETTSPLLVRRLQYAQAALARGNTSTARKRFQRLRDDLVKQREEFIGYERKNELAILNYVEHQLLKLK